MQGMALAPLGMVRRLPHRSGIYFPFYHGLPTENVPIFRRHLRAFAARGRFISWDDAVDTMAGEEEPGPVRFCLSFDDGHKDWVNVLLPILHEFEAPATFFITVNNVTSAAESRRRLTWGDCRRLVEDGMGVGSHTISHARLAVVDPARARREIFDSKAVLEDRLGTPVRDFAAPYGLPGIDYLLDRDVELIKEAGYRCLATTDRGAMLPGDCPFLIRRSGLSSAWPLPAVRHLLHVDHSVHPSADHGTREHL
jgi:peptidoglycan/xylan/chitin deacetylase (PgdA/CDA1 family)